MGIFCKGKISGEKGEVETDLLLNTGSDYVLLPRSLAEHISPKPAGEEEFILADGRVVKRRVHEVEVEIEDHAGKRKGCRAFATIEERPDAVVGFEVMRELGLIPYPSRGKAYFEER